MDKSISPVLPHSSCNMIEMPTDQPRIENITPLIKGLVVTGKILFMATVIAGLVAFCIFVPPLGWSPACHFCIEAIVLSTAFIAGLIALGGTISMFAGLIMPTDEEEGAAIGRFSDMFRYTDHNGLDCGLFLINSFLCGTIWLLPMIAMGCIMAYETVARNCFFIRN